MSQKLLTPLKKLPQQIQNLSIFQKLQDLTSGKPTGTLSSFFVSSYGVMDQPVGLAYDRYLCLLAVAYSRGYLEIYGMPGLSFPVDCIVKDVKFIEFLRNEGRLLLATSSNLVILELNARSGHWEKKHSVALPFVSEEEITAVAIGKDVVYVGSSAGVLRQVAVDAGNMAIGDDDLTSLSPPVILNKIPEDKRELLRLNSAIVSIELYPDGKELLLGYAGGTAIVVQPQTLPVAPQTTAVDENCKEPVVSDEKPEDAESVEKPASKESKEPLGLEAKKPEENLPVTTEASAPKKSRTSERSTSANLQSLRTQATKKFRTLSKTIKDKIEHTAEERPVSVPIPAPPSPRVVRLLPHTQALCCATWRITPSALLTTETSQLEVLIAYDDGAYLTWTIPKSELEVEEPVIAAHQDVASIPYGPLPCAPIQRIVARPSVSDSVITAFVGGLPRAQHAEKHTLTVLGGGDEHVCFQFGSAIRDFVVLPSHPSQPECKVGKNAEHDEPRNEAVHEQHECESSEQRNATEVGYLLVLTECELVAIDLTQPSWPVIPSPYLKHLDCSEITALAHISVPSKLMASIKASCSPSGFEQWPVIGGRQNGFCSGVVQHPEFNDILAIAHANSDVSLWHIVRGNCFHCLGRIHTLSMFEVGETGCHIERKAEEEAWPPFRRVGDCVGDAAADPRCAVRTLSLQLVDDELVLLAGGTAGNFTLWSTACQGSVEADVPKISVDLLDGVVEKFIWEGSESFRPLEGVLKPCSSSCPVFGLCCLVQFNPPSSITAVTYEPRWQALAVGSLHGFALIDLKSNAVVYKQLTHDLLPVCSEPLQPSGVRGAASKIVASGRQLKETLRESFRKIRKIRSQHSTAAVSPPSREDACADKPTTAPSTETVPSKDDVEEAAAEAADEAQAAVAEAPAEEAKPKDEEVDAASEAKTVAIEEPAQPCPCRLRPSDTAFGVSALSMADTYVIPGLPAVSKENRQAFPAPRTATLFVGTQSGAVIAHTLAWPVDNGPIEVKAVKEVHFQHAAPIVGFCVLDAKLRSPLVCNEKKRCVPEVIPEPPAPIQPEAEDPQPGEPATPENGDEATQKPDEQQSQEQKPTASGGDSEGKAVEGGAKVEASKATVDCHELLVCTEGQVRIMMLPSLKTKHKYRFWEKTATGGGGHGGFKPSAIIQRRKSEQPASSAANVVEATPPTETKEAEGSATKAPVATPESDSRSDQLEQTDGCAEKEEKPAGDASAERETAPPSICLHRVAAFGLQKFPGCEDWYAVVALRDGRLNILTVPGLRRILKALCCEHPECCSNLTSQQAYSSPCVSSCANLVFWPVVSRLVVANEISFSPPCRLASPVCVHGLRGTGEESYCVCLPAWARPSSAVATATGQKACLNAEPDVAECYKALLRIVLPRVNSKALITTFWLRGFSSIGAVQTRLYHQS
uniref:LLGL domain-containing protein n=1 Tax=Mesocestoides corti TaxID=53468 RepID=A0A5K3EIZ6_MESCO